MLILSRSTDKLSVNTDVACDVDVIVNYIDRDQTTGAVGAAGKQLTTIATAATTDIAAAPSSGVSRNIKTIHIRNANVTIPEMGVSCNVTFDANGTLYELYRATLYIGDALEYVEGVGFKHLSAETGGVPRLNARSFVDSANTIIYSSATVDTLIPGLRIKIPTANTPVCFLAHIYHAASAATVGLQLLPAIENPGVGGSFIKYQVAQMGVNLNSVTASSLSCGASNNSLAVVNAALNGPTVISLTILSGYIQHTTATALVLRVKVDVALVSSLLIQPGSWLEAWEPTG